MGNKSFCQSVQNLQNYNHGNIPSSRMSSLTPSKRSVLELRSTKQSQKIEEKIIKHIEGDIYEIMYTDGGLYCGTIKDEFRHGKGRYRYADGTTYDGQWELDEAKGKGTLKTDKFTLVGQFSNNTALHGIMTIHKKKFTQIYEGRFKDFGFHGKGKLIIQDHSTYEGYFRNNKKHGRGVLVYVSGSKYCGQFKYGQMQGQGTYTTLEYTYKGEFFNNKFHGKGECIWKNGSTYIGQFQNGKRKGFGSFVNNQGDEMSCYWDNNKPSQLLQYYSSKSFENSDIQ